MSDLLKRDSTVKIISVLFAIFLWFFVLDSTNPTISTDMNISLRVENEAVLKGKNIVIKNANFPKNVTISLRGRKDKISRVNSAETEAVVDLSKVSDVTTKFLYVEVYGIPAGVSFESVTPRVVNFELEKIGENPYPVEIVTTGEAKEKYKVVGVGVSPQTVSIEATDSVINSIGQVKAFVDITDIKDDSVLNLMCKVYDKEGKEMPQFDNKFGVEVKVEVAKEVPVIPVVKGRPAKDFVDGVHKVVQDKALISGASDVLDQIDNLKTEPIDIENLSESTIKTANIVVPNGVSLVNTQKTVNVSIVIEPLAVKNFKFTPEDIILENELIDGSLTYKIMNTDININIKGTSEELDKIIESGLKPSIDVRGLGEGTFKRSLKVVLPGTVQLSENVELELVIEKNEE
ncbi:CdaR family protein [Acetivibrio cellulolyticus]|uniref:CdaR family protein n=1 Tax=Acetivibrio cellulolyticus TaxID=35830 RepID=UPI0001E2FB0E|nr:CdaR family protein [Acetivibrio cellulolyticus]